MRGKPYFKTTYNLDLATLAHCSNYNEDPNGYLHAWCLKRPPNARLGLSQWSLTWFEENIGRLTPVTREMLLAALHSVGYKWGYPLAEQHLEELLTIGTVKMSWERKVEHGR